MTIKSRSRICSWHCSSHVAGVMPAANLAGNVYCSFNKREVELPTPTPQSLAWQSGAVSPQQCQLRAAWHRPAGAVDRWLLPMPMQRVAISRRDSCFFPPSTSAFQISILHPLLHIQISNSLLGSLGPNQRHVSPQRPGVPYGTLPASGTKQLAQGHAGAWVSGQGLDIWRSSAQLCCQRVTTTHLLCSLH